MTMAVRRESVEIHVDSNMTTVMARDAASIALVRQQLDGLNNHPIFQANASGAVVRVDNRNIQQTTTNIRNLDRQATSTSASLNQTGQSINQLTGRLGLFADAALILGPGLIPIAAVGVQALGGLTAAATAAAVAGGSAIVAFQGVGDALKALQAYADDSSIENLDKAREALKGLAPEAKQFVVEFQKFKPVLADIRNEAAAGWFPGLTASLDDFERLAPRIEQIFNAAGQAGGFLVDDVAGSLASSRWAPFLDFLEDEVPTAMASLTRIMGDLGHGAAQMFMAFDPGNDDFLAWLEDVADSFDRWASSAEGRESIADFLDYARQNGPAVAELFKSLVGALTAIVKAAAPLGGPVLAGLTAVSEMVRTIAESDMATPLLAAVAAMRLMQRVQGVVVAGQARINASMRTTAATSVSTAQAMAAQRVQNSANTVNPWSYTGVRGAASRDYGAALAAGLVAPRPQDVRAQQRAQRMQYARAGGTAAGVGLLASGAASEIGLTNTAMLTLAGSMAGPVGAALGAVAGLSMDAARANNDLTASLEAAGKAINSGDFASGIAALTDARSQQSKLADKFEGDKGFLGGIAQGASPGFWKNKVEELPFVGNGKSDVEDGEQALKALERQMFLNEHAAGGLAKAMGENIGPLDGSARSVKELQAALEAAQPAMDQLGISQEELFDAKKRDDKGGWNVAERLQAEAEGVDSYEEMTAAIAARAKWMDTIAGKAENYRSVLSDLGREEGTAADRADNFRKAFEAMVDPANDAEAALSAQVESIRTIRKLRSGGGFNVRTETGRENLAATRAYTDAVKERIATMINAQRPEKEIAGALDESRRQFIESGVAAGFSARQMKKRADAIGLTPDLVQTTFEALNISAFDRAVDSLTNKIKRIPARVQTDLQANGIPKTIAEVDSLVAKYNLTDKQRTALISLVGAAQTEADALALSAVLDQAARNRQTRIDITTYKRTVEQGNRGQGPLRNDSASDAPRSADGSTVPKTGLPYADRHPYLLADGEEVISNRHGQADRHRSLLKAINAGRLADGGTTGNPFSYITETALNKMSSASLAREYAENAKALKEFQRSLKASTSALERERQKRDDFVSYRAEVAGSLGGELVGNGLAGLRAGLGANRNDARSALYALRKAKKNGLDGPLFDLIASSGDINLIQQAASLSRRETAQLERQYGATTSAQNALGRFAAEEKYDTTLRGLDKTIKSLDRQTRRLGKSVERGAERGTRLGTERRSRKTSTGTRAGR